MEEIIKTYAQVFVITMMIVIGVLLCGQALYSRNANDFVNNCVQKLENSNVADSVLDECIQNADKNFNDANKDGVLDSGEHCMTYKPYVASGDRKCGTLTMEYSYKIPLLNIDSKRYIYADVN